MTMHPLKSSHLHSVGYDDNESRMHVKFKSGSTYVYHSVPKTVFDGLKNASSPGKYFHGNVNGAYEGKPLHGYDG